MTLLAIALLGGLVWLGLRGQADPVTFAVGVLVAAVAAWAARLPWRGVISPVRLARGAAIVARLAMRFALDLAIANARQLRLVLAPNLNVKPRWIHFTSRLEHPVSRVILGVLISLTPGTVTQDLRGSEFFVHVLDSGSDEDTVTEIRERFEELLLRLETV